MLRESIKSKMPQTVGADKLRRKLRGNLRTFYRGE